MITAIDTNVLLDILVPNEVSMRRQPAPFPTLDLRDPAAVGKEDWLHITAPDDFDFSH